MNKERKKQIRLDAVIKVQNFLEQCKYNIENGISFSTDRIAKELKMSRTSPKYAFELGVLKKGEVKGQYFLGEKFGTDRATAKKIIESARLNDVEKMIEKSIELKNNSLELNSKPTAKGNKILEQDVVPKIQSNTAHDIASILKKAIPQQTINLFSDKEKEFEDKLKIACAIASGQYSKEFKVYKPVNDWIVDVTNDLYSKLKNNK